jgi:hypothetical protein
MARLYIGFAAARQALDTWGSDAGRLENRADRAMR